LAAWIEQTLALTCRRILAVCLSAFVAIAGAARQPQITAIVVTAGSFGDDVIDLQRVIRQGLWRKAIAAPVAGVYSNLFTH